MNKRQAKKHFRKQLIKEARRMFIERCEIEHAKDIAENGPLKFNADGKKRIVRNIIRAIEFFGREYQNFLGEVTCQTGRS